MKNIIVILVFLVSAFAMAQTTVTLEDQCNCEVLSGTAVTAAGMTTPAGADIGDIYVNTNTGTIYFWDGNSWALTSTDSQQLQNFSFDSVTNILSLEIERGNTVSVNLSALADDQTAAEVNYDNSTSLLMATTVQAAIDEINTAAGTVALTDNGDGTYDFTDAAGITTTISDTSISTMTDNGDGTYTYTDEAGNPTTIDTRASSNPYDNTASGLTATNVQTAIDEINTAAGTIALTDNGDGTYDFTDAGGNTTTISDTSISTMTDNGDGTYTYTNETGATQTIDTNGITLSNTVVGNRIATVIDASGASTDINETVTSVVDNNDGTITYTDENGADVIIDKSQLNDNGDGTYTFDDGDGFPITFVGTDDQTSAEVTYDNTTSGLSATNVQTAIDEINTAAGTVALLDNGDGTYLFTDASGATTTISDSSISTLAGNGDGTYTYTDEAGNATTIDTSADSNPYDNTASGLAATDVQGAIDELNTGSTDDQNISGSALTGTDLTIGIENGTSQTLDLSTLAETVAAGTGAITVDDDGAGNYTVNSTDPDEDLTNELTLVGTGAPTVTPTHSGVTYVDDAAGQLYVYDGAAWQQVGGNASPDLDPDPTNERNTAFAVNAGNLEITDSGGTLFVPVSSLGTDDQNISGSGLTGTDLTIGIENGSNETVDLSSLVGTDDQTISLAGNTLTLEDGGTVDLAPYLDNTDDQAITDFSLDGTTNVLTLTLEDGGTQTVDLSGFVSSDDQNISGSGLTGTDLTIGIENGSNETVDLSSLVGTDDQTISLVGNTLTLEDGGTVDLALFLDNTDNQAITDFSLDGTTNILTLTLEDGGTQTVDLSGFVSSDDQQIGLAGNTLTLEDGGTVDLSPYLDDTDDQTVTDFNLGAGDILSITLEDGNTRTVDLSSLNNAGTDDQTAAEVNYDNTASGLAAAEVQSAIDELAADSTDDQNISGSGLSGTDLTIGIENGTNETVDLSSLLGTDDQNLSTDGTAGNISIEDGNSISLNVNDADSDPGNEYNTAIGTTSGNLEITDNGGTLSTSLISADANNDIAAGTDGALYLNVSSVTISETITNLTDTNDGLVTYTNESGATQKVAKANITDNGNGTYTFTNNDGSDVLLDTRASSNPYDNTTSGLTATDTQAALDELSAGSTDDQNLVLSGTDLSIEDGNTVDLSGFVSTDDQNLALTGNTLTLEDGGSVDLSPYLDNTDNQIVTDFSLGAGDVLTITLEDGNTRTVDLSALNDNGTDDQNLTLTGTDLSIEDGNTVDLSGFISTDDQVLSLAGNTLTLEDGGTVDLAPYLDNTDDQAITDFSLDGTTHIITLTLEDGGTQTVDLSGFVSSDDQNISGSGLSGTDLTIGIENGTNETVDLSSLVGTDDQAISLAGNTLTLEDGGTVDLAPYLDNTDDQAITDFSLDGTTHIITLTLEDGGTQTVDLSGFVSTDDQNLTGASLNASNILQIDIENGTSTTVDLSALNDSGTDDQQLTFAANTLSLEDGGTVDLSGYLDNTDDQNIENLAVNTTTNVLTVGIEDGSGQTVDLSHLDNAGSDDQNLSLTGNTLAIEDGNTIDLGGYLDNTDDQQLSLAGNTLTLEDGGTVDLSSYLDNTDDQTVTDFNLGAGDILSITLEDGNTRTVDLSSLNNAGTDDQTAAEVNYDNTASGLSAAEVQSAIDELAVGSTDDQSLTLVGNTLTLEDGGTVDLGPYLDDTDDQTVTAFDLDGSNVLTITLEDGNTRTVNLSGLDNSGSDDQDIENLAVNTTTNVLTVGIEDGTGQNVDLSHLDNSGTDDQNLSLTGNLLAIEDGNDVDLSGYLDNTDDQNIENLGLSGNTLTVGIENGTAQTVDLSALDNSGTDNQNLTGASLSAGNLLQIDIEDGTSTTVDLSALDNSGTDDQNIESLGLSGTTLTVGIENGTSQMVDLASIDTDTDRQDLIGASLNASNILQVDIENGASTTVDLSALDNAGSDDQNLSLTGNTLAIEDGNNVDLSGYLDNTDDQNIENLGLAGNILTVGIESGTAQTVDLSALNNSGTDNQNLAGANLNASNILQIDIEDGTSTTVDLSSLDDNGTDDQNLTLTGTDLSIEDGNSVDLSGFVSTDDQNISGSGLSGTDLTIGIENGTNEVIDLSSLVGTDNQNLTGATLNGSNVLQIDIEDGTSTSVDLSALDNTGTDDQNIEALAVNTTTNVLTVGIEDGTAQTVDLSHLDDAGTDDQNLSLTGNTLAIEDGNNVDLSGYLDNTDNQNIENLGLAGNILTVGIESGTAQTVDLSALNNSGTDNQNLTAANLNASNILQIDIENGTSTTVDLSSLDNSGTDNQNLSLTGNTLSIENGNNVDLGGYLDNTDNQNISGSGLSGNILTIGIQNGTNETVDLSSLSNSGTDDQFDDEVDLRTPIDVDDAGKIAAEVVAETNVQEVIEAIAPITSKAARIFYPPSIAVDASTNGTGRTIDLYDQYITQFGTPMVSSNLAPTAIPTYANTELYYYVTFYDTNVFDNVSVDEFGEMTYDVIDQPSDYNSLINVVFVVK